MDLVTIFGRLFAVIAAAILIYILYNVVKQAWAHHRTHRLSGSSFPTTWRWKPRREPDYQPLDGDERDEGEGELVMSGGGRGAEQERYRDSLSTVNTPVVGQSPWTRGDLGGKPLPERPLPDKPLPPVPGGG